MINPKKVLFKHKFKGNLRLEVTETGFTLWDDGPRRWVLDASTLVRDKKFWTAAELATDSEIYSHSAFKAKYPPVRKSKKK